MPELAQTLTDRVVPTTRSFCLIYFTPLQISQIDYAGNRKSERNLR